MISSYVSLIISVFLSCLRTSHRPEALTVCLPFLQNGPQPSFSVATHGAEEVIKP